MTHKDKATRQYRVWLRPETVRQIKLLSLILGREDWNMVMDDCARTGVAYFNDFGKLELVDFKGELKLENLKNVPQRMVSGQLLPVEEQ